MVSKRDEEIRCVKVRLSDNTVLTYLFFMEHSAETKTVKSVIILVEISIECCTAVL